MPPGGMSDEMHEQMLGTGVDAGEAARFVEVRRYPCTLAGLSILARALLANNSYINVRSLTNEQLLALTLG